MLNKYRTLSLIGILAILLSYSCIDLEPETDTGPAGREYTVTAFLLGPDGPLPGALVTFEVISGPSAGRVSIPDSGECYPNDCTSTIMGTVSWTYTSTVAGTDIIEASFLDLQLEQIIAEPVEKIWTSPIPTLNTWGLAALVIFLGAVGILAFRKIKATQ